MSTHVSRQAALAGLGSAIAATAFPHAASADPTLLRISVVPIFDIAPMYAAQAEGYLTAENLAITTQAVQSGVIGLPALISGAYDIGYSNSTSVLVAMSRGLDLRIIIQGSPIGKAPPDPGALLRRKGENLRNGKDMEGKVIGVNGLRDIQWMVVRAWIKATGGDPAKVDLREVPLPQMADAIKNKQVDSALLLDPFMTVGLGDPALELLDWPFSKVYANGPPAFWVVTGQTAERRPELVRAFVRAYKRGVTWVNANQGKDAYLKLVAGYTRIDPELARKMHAPPANATIYPESITILTTMMTEHGLLTTPVDVRSKIFT